MVTPSYPSPHAPKSTELLKVISSLEPLSFHPKIKAAIAMSTYSDEEMQKRFFKEDDYKILEALSLNKNLSEDLVKEFLNKKQFILNVARSRTLNEKLFELLQDYPASLAMNESLSSKMQKELLDLKSSEINYALSLNNNLEENSIRTLLELDNEEIRLSLYENNSTPSDILKEAYKNSDNHMALAKNENTPIEILYQLQLDSKYERAVKTNAAYGKHIQSENIGWLV